MRWFIRAPTEQTHHLTTNFSVSHSTRKVHSRSLSDLKPRRCVLFYDCSRCHGAHKQGCWLGVCISFWCNLVSCGKCTISPLRPHWPSRSLSTYYTLTCFISLLLPALPPGLLFPLIEMFVCVCREWCRTCRSWWCHRVTSHSVQIWTEVSAASARWDRSNVSLSVWFYCQLHLARYLIALICFFIQIL